MRVPQASWHRNGSEHRRSGGRGVRGVRWPRPCVTLSVNLTEVIEPVTLTFSAQRWTLIWERGKRIRRWRVRAFRVDPVARFFQAGACARMPVIASVHLQFAHVKGALQLGIGWSAPSDALRVSCPEKGFLFGRGFSFDRADLGAAVKSHSPLSTERNRDLLRRFSDGITLLPFTFRFSFLLVVPFLYYVLETCCFTINNISCSGRFLTE